MERAIAFGVLGPLEVVVDGRDRTPTGALQRRLLSLLLLNTNQVVSADALADVLWPDTLPADHHAALHTHVSRLRQLVPSDQLARVGGGYRLQVGPGDVDAARFTAAVSDAAAQRATDPGAALASLDEALAWWRGTPYEDLAGVDAATIEAERLVELRLRAHEERFDCLLALGRHADALADLDAFASRHPLHERVQGQLMTALRHTGRLADALAVYDRYRKALATELGIEPSPALRRLHDDIVTGATEDDSSAARQTASEPAPRETRSTPRHPLTRPASSFVGRSGLLETVPTMLHEHRLVTLLGTGGAGKTRLAQELCARLGHAYPDGVWFCALATADAQSVAATVAFTLDVEQRSDADPADRIADVLRHQQALLVLDNCEHVLDAAARLADTLLAAAPSVTVLATSRERLAIDGEQLCPVPPLPVPQQPDADEPAIRLFCDRATAVRPDWRPDTAEIETIADICRHLDGLPLAIELAAARLHTLTLDEVADGLDRRMAMLTGGKRTTIRHRSLAAAVAWSYDLLDDDERAMFDAVSVFQAAFSAEGAAAVADVPRDEAADTLSGLVERSLLQREGRRYLMLESLREYGIARLAERDAVEAARSDHARYHLAFAVDAEQHLREPNVIGVLDDVDASLADIRVAFNRLVEEEELDETLHLVLALHEYGVQRIRPEVLEWAEQTAHRAAESGRSGRLVGEAFAVGGLGAWKRGDLARARELEDAARAFTGSDDNLGGTVFDLLTTRALVQGELDEVIHWAEIGIAQASSRGDFPKVREARGLIVLARGYQGDPGVVALADDLLARIDENTNILSQAFMWYVAGEAMIDIDHAAAMERLRRAMELARQSGTSFVLGIAGSSLASLEARHGDPVAAVHEYRWVLDHWRRAGIRSLLSTTLRSVAQLLARIGHDRAAALVLGRATAPDTRHEIFGEDVHRLRVLAETLTERLGGEEFEAATAKGAALDDNDAVAVAYDAFDLWEARRSEER